MARKSLIAFKQGKIVQEEPTCWGGFVADPLIWLTLLGFGIPFILQVGFYPFQKLSMFSEDPSAYREMPARLPRK